MYCPCRVCRKERDQTRIIRSLKSEIKELKKKGWKSESVRHSLARKGIKTGRKKR